MGARALLRHDYSVIGLEFGAMVEPVGLVLGGMWAFSQHKKRRANTQRELIRIKKEEAEATLEAEAERRRNEKQARRRELEAVEHVDAAALRSLSREPRYSPKSKALGQRRKEGGEQGGRVCLIGGSIGGEDHLWILRL